MKPLPRDRRALLEEATSLGLLGPDPSLEKPRAKLLECIHSSMKIKRSFNHVSILLVGSTGVGKSATVNHLLGVGLAQTSENESKTRSTKEYIVHGSDPQYEVEELPLGLIDTPGFCDTDGSKQDACNLLSMHEFFCTHPTLSNSCPNLILLFVNATDNRIKGENSELGKSLRCIKQLGLVDSKNPNVVTILTHACSVLNKQMKRMKSDVSKIVFEDLEVFAPVVAIENMYGCDDWNLESVGDYTRLPSGELQPKNLYEACAGVLKNNRDSFGLITLNSIFVNPKKGPNRPVTSGHECKAKNARKCTFDRKEKGMVELFENAATGGLRDPVYTATLAYISERRPKDQEVEETMEIARILKSLRKGDPPNFESHSIDSIEFSLDKEISSAGQKMLEEKFKIKKGPTCELFKSGSVNVIGEGYNILNDKSVVEPIVQFEVVTKYGIAIPTCAEFEKVNQSQSFMEVFEDEKSYTLSRLKSLNVDLTVKPDIFNMDCRAGYNRIDSTSSSFTSEYSFLLEQRLFKLTIDDYKECLNRGMTFTEDFKSDVAKLPSTYDKSDSSCVSTFERFFCRFGHFFVSSAYAGGSVEVKCSKEATKSTTRSLEKVKVFLITMLEELKSEGIDILDSSETKALLEQSIYSCKGGKEALLKKKTINDRQKLQEWKESLIRNPTMLTSELTLDPISTAVGCIDASKEQATYDALKDLLKSEIKKSTLEKIKDSVKVAITRIQTIVNPDQTGNRCFPSDSVVKVQNNDGEEQQKEMANLNVGDKVMSWDQKRNRAVFTKVIMFAHLAPDAVDVEYLKITLEDGNEITLSGNHLVMVGKQTKAILARKVKPGDILFNVNENQEILPKKVLAVEKVMEQGIFCPITLSGNVIVDNVLASCYASVEDHVLLKGLVKISAQNMAHLGLMPMRALHKLRSKWLRKIPNGQTIHPYVQWLCKLNHPCMAH